MKVEGLGCGKVAPNAPRVPARKIKRGSKQTIVDRMVLMRESTSARFELRIAWKSRQDERIDAFLLFDETVRMRKFLTSTGDGEDEIAMHIRFSCPVLREMYAFCMIQAPAPIFVRKLRYRSLAIRC